jgi:predicted DNA-binding protein
MPDVPTDPLPSDWQENLARLSDQTGLTPTDVLREALELYARELEDRQSAERAERITPRTAELKVILARSPRPSTWYDSDESLF